MSIIRTITDGSVPEETRQTLRAVEQLDRERREERARRAQERQVHWQVGDPWPAWANLPTVNAIALRTRGVPITSELLLRWKVSEKIVGTASLFEVEAALRMLDKIIREAPLVRRA